MNVVKYNPFRSSYKPVVFDDVFDDFFGRSLSDVFGTEFTTSTPSVNIIEKDGSYEIEVAAPGLTKEDFNVEIDKDRLTISATKESHSDESKDKFSRREFNYSSFKRSFHLSKDIDKDSINATYVDGVLRIDLRKTEEAKNTGLRTIEIS